MNKRMHAAARNCLRAGLAVLIFFSPRPDFGMDRIQIEIYGGLSLINPKDLNLISKAEEGYNDLMFFKRLGWMDGYFLNDFPEIRSMIPAGIRLKYRAGPKLSLSLGLEGFYQRRQESPDGTFSYTYTSGVYESYTKTYDPFRLSVSGFALLGGVHYRIPVAAATGLEVGLTAGWVKVNFDFVSDWTYEMTYDDASERFTFLDSKSLEGQGSGQGLNLQALFRLNRDIGRGFGLFVEGSYSYCRLTSLEGTGHESWKDFPEGVDWEDKWGIRREEIEVGWGEVSLDVPSNYWGEWTAAQRTRDFVLDLSGFRLALGFSFRL